MNPLKNRSAFVSGASVYSTKKPHDLPLGLIVAVIPLSPYAYTERLEAIAKTLYQFEHTNARIQQRWDRVDAGTKLIYRNKARAVLTVIGLSPTNEPAPTAPAATAAP